ncbi:polysaccharide biosynthesis protein [Clostridiales bacterium oral taxon 876 str. F0540]|nr:polysaccharide biosynthesis protein [Clostridiales bacterium oral taxon 876 str. F0540]
MKTQSTTKGFAILSAAGMIGKLLSLLYVPLLHKYIGEDGYGVYYATYTVFTFIYIITNTGLSSAISKIVSELIALKNYKDAVKAFKMARLLLLILGTLMSIIMLVLATTMAKLTHFPTAYLAIQALAPAVLLTSIASAYRGYFQGRGNMTATAVSQILEQLINVVLSLIFAALWSKYGVVYACAGATVGTTVGALVSVGYLMYYYRKNKGFNIEKLLQEESVVTRYSNEQLLKKLLNYAVPLTISWGLQNAGNVIDAGNTKGRLLKAGFSDVQANVKYDYLAKYQVLINVPITIISALCAAVLPLISGAAALKERDEIKKGIDYAYKTCLLIAVPSAVGLAVLSQPIFNTIFARYSSGAVLMKYGSVVLVFMALVQIQVTILQSIGKLYISTLYIVVGIGAKIALNYVLIAKPSINILGAVFGSIVGFLIPLLLNNYIIKRSLKIKYNLIALAVKPIIASALMGVTCYLVQFDIDYVLGFIHKGYFTTMLSTVTAIAAGIFTYLYGLILIGGITSKELQAVPVRIRRLIPKTLLKRIR